MSADIEKLAVFDDRIVQSRPKYAVEKGALSLTNSPFNAIAATQSQHTYNIYVPSENVYVDRALEWSSTVFLKIDVRLDDSVPGNQFPANEPLFELGVDGSLAAFPLNSLTSTMTATINDTTVVINSQDVLKEVLRLTDYKQNRLQRTCPTMLDKYQRNSDALNATNDPIAPYTFMSHDYHEVPNGSWANIVYTDPDGVPLVGTQSPAYTFGGIAVNTIDGVPVSTNTAGVVNGLYSVFIKFRTTEKLVLSPFVFAEQYANDTGLFGINNIQLVMNMRDPNRAIRLRNKSIGTARKRYYSGGALPTDFLPPISYNTRVGAGVFQDSVINCMFLTPSLSIPLPPKSVVPYMEFPRYITQPQNTSIPAGATAPLQSQTITLPQIPDLLIIYVKALADPTALAVSKESDPNLPQFGDAYLPVECSVDGTRSLTPLSVNFDNFSGLLSSTTSEQLYAMAVRNGLEVDWNTWSGFGRTNAGLVGGKVATVGGFLVLKPGIDITLQEGQSCSLVGNFTLQFNLRVRNTFNFAVQPQIYVITANSGFFESVRGSSRIIKGVLSEQDIISAPLAPAGTREGLKRMVGGKMLELSNRLGMCKGHSGGAPKTHGDAGRQREAVAAAATGRRGIAARVM
jgi:hypothetical protein